MQKKKRCKIDQNIIRKFDIFIRHRVHNYIFFAVCLGSKHIESTAHDLMINEEIPRNFVVMIVDQ